MKTPTWDVVWGAWIAYFAVAETVALRSGDPEAPLSHTLRSMLATRHQRPFARYAGQVALGAGIVWLVAHLYESE